MSASSCAWFAWPERNNSEKIREKKEGKKKKKKKKENENREIRQKQGKHAAD
jgi:hypothetical protein